MAVDNVITVLECTNGWTAIYGPTGQRIGKFSPSQKQTHDMQLDWVARSWPGVDVVVQSVPANPDFKDFPVSV